MVTRGPSSKIYLQKVPFLKNFVPQKFPNIRYTPYVKSSLYGLTISRLPEPPLVRYIDSMQ